MSNLFSYVLRYRVLKSFGEYSKSASRIPIYFSDALVIPSLTALPLPKFCSDSITFICSYFLRDL